MCNPSRSATLEHHPDSTSATADPVKPRVTSDAPHVLAQFAFQDWFLLAYLLVYFFAVWNSAPSDGRTLNLQRIGLLTITTIPLIVAVRAGFVKNAVMAPIVYRLGVFGISVASYFMLKDLLPVVFTRADQIGRASCRERV